MLDSKVIESYSQLFARFISTVCQVNSVSSQQCVKYVSSSFEIRTVNGLNQNFKF